MEKLCEIEFGKKSAVSTSRVEIFNTNDAELPLLSVTAPSEEVSEVEDNLGSSTSQTPAREQADEIRDEAQRIVGDVLTQASEILQSQTSTSTNDITTVIENSTTIHYPLENNRHEMRWIDEEEKERWKNDPEIRSTAQEFVKELLEKALEEAKRRLSLNKDTQEQKGSREHLLELNEIVETMSSGGPDKRRPWYRRARTSASKLLNRLCVCGRANR